MTRKVSKKTPVPVADFCESPAEVPISADLFLCDSLIYTSDFFGIFFQMSFPIFCFTVWDLYPTL